VIKVTRDDVHGIAREAFGELVMAVEAGKSETLKEYLRAMGRFHRYSLGNALLIRFQKPHAVNVAGFRTWQRLGRHVRKGERGIAIMAPVVYRKEVEACDNDEMESSAVRAFRTAYVFDISQTEGRPLPEFARVRGNPEQYLDRLRRFVRGKGIQLRHSARLTTMDGISSGGTILLRESLESADEFSVLAHELAHEMLHRDERNRPLDRKVRETEAEAVAYVVCQGIGLDVGTASSDYIQLYDGDSRTLMESLERIQRTASEILEGVVVGEQG
jgi:antirestriction protein ArdC